MKFLFAVVSAILLPPFVVSDSTNADTRNDLNEVGALLNHLQTMEAVVKQLLRRVEQLETQNEAQEQTIKKHLVRIEHLESRDNDQQQLILNLRRELVVQRQRTDSLERFIEKISKVACQPEDTKKGVSQTGIQPARRLPAQTTSVASNKTYVEENSPEDQKVPGNGYQPPFFHMDTLAVTYEEQDCTSIHKTQASIRIADKEETIAFFATLSKNLLNVTAQQTFVFDHVVTNLGQGYSNRSGNFVAPVPGTYVFSATLMSLYHQYSHSQFTKNGQPVSFMYVSGGEAPSYDTTSQTIVVQLQKGDDICIRNINANKSYHGTHYSTFSGFLLQQNVSVPAVVGREINSQ